MESAFSQAALNDPEMAAASDVVRQCVHCGFCNATCPTYQLSQDEGDGPRGRIWIMHSMLSADRAPTALELNYLDRCLTCLSCTTTCPAGVNYLHLADIARTHIHKKGSRPRGQKLVRALLTHVLPYPQRLAAALSLSKFTRFARPLLPAALARLARAADGLSSGSATLPLAEGTHSAHGTKRMRVLMLTGCAQARLGAEINHATQRLLNRLGVEVVIPEGSGCCGALSGHLGHHDESQDQIRRLLAQWEQADAETPVDRVVINASGCGFHVKDWGFIMRRDPRWAAPAARFAALARDLTEIVAELGLPQGPRPEAISQLPVALHLPCSLQHGQKIVAEPKLLLEAAGFRVLLPTDSHLCCGAAGTYAITQPEASAALQGNKIAAMQATGAALMVSSNMGCMKHLAPGLGMPVVHLAQALDWATGGPALDLAER